MANWIDIQRIGVGFLENYGSGVDAEFPHYVYTFELSIDRDVMIAQMRADDHVVELCSANSRSGLESAFSELCEKLVRRFSST